MWFYSSWVRVYRMTQSKMAKPSQISHTNKSKIYLCSGRRGQYPPPLTTQPPHLTGSLTPHCTTISDFSVRRSFCVYVWFHSEANDNISWKKKKKKQTHTNRKPSSIVAPATLSLKAQIVRRLGRQELFPTLRHAQKKKTTTADDESHRGRRQTNTEIYRR